MSPSAATGVAMEIFVFLALWVIVSLLVDIEKKLEQCGNLAPQQHQVSP